MASPAQSQPLEGLTVRGAHAAAVRRGMTPRARLKVSQTAAEHRYIAPGVRYSMRKTPFFADPMDCMEPGQFLTVCIVGPAQVGKTTGPENLLLHSVMNSPGDFLWYMQSDEALQAYVKKTIDPMIALHPEMKGALGLKAIDDSLHFKKFRTMNVEFLTATSKNMINKKAPRIVGDEIDAYPKDIGDPKVLLDKRRQTYGAESVFVAVSHPDRATGLRAETDWTEGIMAIFADSDQRLWYWPCPHCGAWSSPCPTAQRVMTLEYDTEKPIEDAPDRKRLATLDEVEASAHLECPVNGCVIEDRERRAMNAKGKWVGDGQSISEDGTVTGTLVRRKTAGFWVVGIMSPFLLGGIGGLARERVKAERDYLITGEEATLRNVMTKGFGVPFQPKRNIGSIDANTLAERADADLKLGEVPEGVRFLIASADVQVGFFEWLVRGWGVNGESWVVDKGRILADPATSPKDWDQLLELFSRQWPLADGSGRTMALRGASYDSAGAPGVTTQAYDAWRRWKVAKKIRYLGKVGGKSGRDVFTVMPTKGANTKNAPKLQVVYPDTARKSNMVAGKGEIPLALFNPNLFKDDLMGQLLRAEAGPWYVNFPGGPSEHGKYGLKSESGQPPHPWFEQVVAEHRQKDGTWELVTASARNEATDLMVMTHVLAHLHGLSRITWERPPPWAAEWDRNTLVKGVASATPEGEVIPAPEPKGAAVRVDAPPNRPLSSRLANLNK